jgi:hypothetical protein
VTYQTDALIHEFWMRRFQDSALFTDPLTTSLLETGYSPPAFRSLYWLASHVVDPELFGELLPPVLQPFAVWLLFRIVRAHVAWRPAAWIGAALFLVMWDVHRFSGGHPRAFAQAIVLLPLFLLLSRRNLAAALVPPLGLLFYPPAGAVALGIVVLAAIDFRRPRFVDLERVRWAAVSVAGVGAAFVLTRLTTGSQDVITEAEARLYPEVGPNGQMHFSASSALEFLTQNYSGSSRTPARSWPSRRRSSSSCARATSGCSAGRCGASRSRRSPSSRRRTRSSSASTCRTATRIRSYPSSASPSPSRRGPLSRLWVSVGARSFSSPSRSSSSPPSSSR